jgi:ABC-2 type transport system permease protein
MDIGAVWTVANKDFSIFRKKKSIIYSLVGFELFVSIVFPLIIRFAGMKSGGIPDAVQYGILNAFSFWFVIGAAILPTGIASYSLIGEKVEKSLEPLLATPLTDSEILMGKSLAAFIPAIASTYAGATVYMFLMDRITYSQLGYLYYPNWTMGIILLALAPLACILSIGLNVLVSANVNDVRTAQQIGGLMFLPFGVYIFSAYSVSYR